MLRPAAALTFSSCALLAGAILAGCGSSAPSSSVSAPGTTASTTSAASAPPKGSLESLAGPAPIGVVPGTEDYQPGRNRVSFLIVDSQSRAISTPTARIWVATGLKAIPYAQTVARSEVIGVPSGDVAPVGSIYVTHVDLPKPGKYWLLVVPNGGPEPVRALANLVVRAKPETPAIGDKAIASKTPTLGGGGTLAVLSTATHPDPRLYRLSVAQALQRHAPFVLTFATPKFCTSRTCGPVVDVVDAVAKKLAGTPVRFIHVEIYQDNDPAKGENRWVKEWNLPTEPFTFLVDSRGVIRAKLEGAFSVGELETTIRSTLLGPG